MTNEFYQDKYPKDFAGVSLENVNAYSQKVFDNSPLNRVLEQAAPGKDWKVGNGHTIKFDYQTNISNEVLNFGVNFTKNDPASPKLTIADSYYNSSTLYKTITKDENWRSHDHTDKTTEEFKNKQEQVVLKRTYNKNVAHDTYYVYDDYGNLSYVIPPLASEKTIVYQTGMKSYPASKFVTGGNPTGTIKFGIQKIAPGKYAYVADFNLHNLANSNFKSGEIMELPLIYSTMKNFWLSCAWVSSGGSYAYVYYYVKNGKLFCNTYVSNRDNISLKIKDFDKTTQQDFPQNLQGFSPAVSQAKMKELLDKLCHQYKYDTRNRLIQKKIPGKGWEYIVYDKLDRPVLTQDANLRASKKWLFTKYDVFGRVAYTGIYTHHKTLSQKQMQTHFEAVNNTAPKYYETKLTTAGSLGIYYNSKNFPTTNLEVYTVNYYDNYTFNRAGTGTSVRNVYGINSTTRLKGLPTGSKVKVLDTNDWITTITYYDDKARPIYVYAKNDYLLSSDIVKSKLDFVGRVIETTSIHTKIDDNLPTITTIDKFEYDHVGRLKKQTQKIGGQAEEVIVANTYNELGKLIKKGVGNTYSSPLQEVDYSYNVRGWLKMINDPKAGLGEKLFSMELLYNDPGDNLRNTKLYNGNISQSIWKTASDNSKRYYNYYYDDLNRIKWAKYYSWNQYYRFNGSFSYDKNGNLLQLYRRGAVVENPEVRNARDYGTMDYLNYTYNGNQLTKVKDTGKKQYGFIDGADTDQEYRYDLNGNMIADANKGIQEIKYNHLNLPTLVDFGNNKSIEYTYDATGTKIRKRVENLSAFTNTDYAGNYIYENNELQFFNHSEGYATPNNLGKFDYIYQYKDHLGNVRLSYTKNHDIDIPETIFTDNATNTQGWNSIGAKYGSSASIATDKSYSGGKSFKIHSTTGNDRYAHSNKWIAIDNNEETEYTFSGRVFVESSGYAWGRISFFMNENDETKYFTEVFDGDAIKTKGKWVYYEKTVTVPANIDKINLRIGLYHQTNNATAWFDDLKIVKGNRSRTTIVEESNYYPFGLKHKGYNNVTSSNGNSVAQKFGYNGKELNEELGLQWHDFSARNYDASLGRWMNIDPLAEQMRRHSPYNYAFNNPIYFIDPDGMKPMDWFENGKGDIVWHDSKEKSFTNDKGAWKNVGANLNEVKEHLKLPADKSFSKSDTNVMAVGNAKGGLPVPVGITVSGKVSSSLTLSNAGESGNERIDGKTEITGVNINTTVGVNTNAPGVSLNKVGGETSMFSKWTPTGKSPSATGKITNKEGPMVRATNTSGKMGTSTISINLKKYNRLTRKHSNTPKSINVKTNITGKHGFRPKVFTTNHKIHLKP
jgi:RHS repeat-associated protein